MAKAKMPSQSSKLKATLKAPKKNIKLGAHRKSTILSLRRPEIGHIPTSSLQPAQSQRKEDQSPPSAVMGIGHGSSPSHNPPGIGPSPSDPPTLYGTDNRKQLPKDRPMTLNPNATTTPPSPKDDVYGVEVGPITRVIESTNPELYYPDEIATMMHAAGDSPNPDPLTIELLENTLRDQMQLLYLLSLDAMKARRGRYLSLEDLLVPIRRNKSLMVRLTDFLNVANIRPLHEHSREDDTNSDNPLPPLYEETYGIQSDPLYAVMVPALLPVGPTEVGPYRRRVPWSIRRALSDIIPDSVIEGPRLGDATHMKRVMRAEKRTRDMTVDEYLAYTACRQFGVSTMIDPFDQWITPTTISDYIKPTNQVSTVFPFLAWETVRKLTEKSLDCQVERHRVMLKLQSTQPRDVKCSLFTVRS
eukprot:Ihof_evm2s258 gene=Ihof_evmTU2s258